MKWGEYSSDVQFILLRSDQSKTSAPEHGAKNPASSPPQANESPKKAKPTFDQPMINESIPSSPLEEQNTKKIKSLETIKINELRRTDLIGIVNGKE